MASNPNTAERLGFAVPTFTIGGVFGKVKLNTPKTSEAIPAIKNVCFSNPSFIPCAESQPKELMASPATIQPIVPQTRIPENDFSGLTSCLNDTELTSASVGM